MGAPDLSAEWREYLRCVGRGGLLDKHMGEIGYTTEIGPTALGVITDADRLGDLGQLSATNRTNPRSVLLNINMRELRPGDAPSQPDFRAQLFLQWGTGKGVAEALVDLRRGLQLVIPCTTLTVGCLYLDDADGVGPRLQVSASMGYGTRPGSEAALTFTTGFTLPLAAGATTATAIRIPAYATRVAWSSPESPTLFLAPDALLVFAHSPDSAVPARSFSNPTRDAFVPIPNGSEYMFVTNLGAAATRYFLTFELSL